MDSNTRCWKSHAILSGVMTASLLLAGCASLPSSGPTGAQIRNQTLKSGVVEGYSLVELSGFADLPPAPQRSFEFTKDYVPAQATDIVGPGDVLDIAIYETGISLFGGAPSPATAVAAGFDASSKVEHLPPARVSDNGAIRVPYVGQIGVAGHSTREIEGLIRRALTGMSQNPQVLVSIREGLTNSVIIGGDIGRPGRLVLPTNRETLSDVIALAGGHKGDVKDITVKVQRGMTVDEFRLSDVLGGPEQDMRVFPGDRISVYRLPRSFSVMGAPGRVEQIPFSGPTVSLVEALAQAGGTNPNLGDPQAIYVFRFNHSDDGTDKPVIYHLNMMRTGSYFLAQRFAMKDKDLLYVGNAAANQPSKLVQIISQLFSPIVTVRNVSGL